MAYFETQISLAVTEYKLHIPVHTILMIIRPLVPMLDSDWLKTEEYILYLAFLSGKSIFCSELTYIYNKQTINYLLVKMKRLAQYFVSFVDSNDKEHFF